MIFHQKRILGWQFWILLCISIGLITADKHAFVVPKIKPSLQMMMIPLEYSVTLPARGFASIRDYFIFQHELIHDKASLQTQTLELQARLQELNALKVQNQELQSLLKTPPVENNQKFLLTHVIAIKQENNTHEILINSGATVGITPGLAVVAGDGIVGQIIQTTPVSSRVMLLNDSRSAIPAINERTKNNLIVIGTGNEELSLLNISNNADVKVGDKLFSSGIGGHFPAGYPVGIISSIEMNGKNIVKVNIKPTTNLHRLHALLVVFINENSTQV